MYLLKLLKIFLSACKLSTIISTIFIIKLIQVKFKLRIWW